MYSFLAIKLFYSFLHNDCFLSNTIPPHLWDTLKVVLWGKYVALTAYTKGKKLERAQANGLTMQLIKLEKQEQNK